MNETTESSTKTHVYELVEVSSGKINFYENGHKKGTVDNINELPILTMFDKKGQEIKKQILPYSKHTKTVAASHL